MTTQEKTFRRPIIRRRRECVHKNLDLRVDYKDIATLRKYITDRGKIIPAKRTGNCAKCQRELTTAIKRARYLAFIPYSQEHERITGKIVSTIDDDKSVPFTEDTKSDSDVETEESVPVTEDTKPDSDVETEESVPVTEDTKSDSDSSTKEDKKSD